jgi:hypothetical protein
MAFIQKIFFILLFIFPIFIAFIRGHNNLIPITLVHIFLSFTIIGYFVALIWSFSDNIKERKTKLKDWQLFLFFLALLIINFALISIGIEKVIENNFNTTYFFQSIIL